MRWLGILALLGACANKQSPPAPDENVSLKLALPHGILDPAGFVAVDVVIHAPDQADDERTATITSVGGTPTFDLGTIAPAPGILIEATLRNDRGAAVGYGRSAVDATFAGGTEIVVQVRRPIAYLAGAVSRENTNTGVVHWTEVPATFSDLSTGATLDGKTLLTGPAVLMVAAGPNLFMITQAVGDTTGVMSGAAKLVPVGTGDHQVATMPLGSVGSSTSGAVLDGAGTDDGTTLVLGTATQLFSVDASGPAATVHALADGSFARVAIAMTAGGAVAIAIKGRGAIAPTCATTAELWWAPLDGTAAHMVATGGFSDIAADRGHAYYVDACKRELGELTAAGTTMLRTLGDVGSATARPTALAVSNGQAYIGFEDAPATTSLVVATIPTADKPAPSAARLLWSEPAQQVLDVMSNTEVRRQLNATGAAVDHLELGAGDDYIALTTSAHFHGNAISGVHFPEMTIDTEELRVFDAATGGTVQRYRSWCDGTVFIQSLNDIDDWECASVAGQTAAAADTLEHHLGSMTFLFGKK